MAFPFLMALSALPAGCHTIPADVVFARDVAAIIPAFTQVAGDFRLGAVPDSGAPRIFEGADLQRIARNQGVELLDPPDVCFALRVFVPQPDEIRAAMRRTLTRCPRNRRSENRDFFFQSTPGPVWRADLSRAADCNCPPEYNRKCCGVDSCAIREAIFRCGRRCASWPTSTRIVAPANIPSGKPIQKSQVRLESCEDSLLDETTARNLDEVVGHLPKSVLRAYLPIRNTSARSSSRRGERRTGRCSSLRRRRSSGGEG